MTKLAPEWVQTSDPVIRSPARYCWTTAPAYVVRWYIVEAAQKALSRANKLVPTKWWCFMPLLCTLFRLNWARLVHTKLYYGHSVVVVKLDISTFKLEISTYLIEHHTISSLKVEISSLKDEISSLKVEISCLKVEISSLKTTMEWP